jgi:hypothetical protein
MESTQYEIDRFIATPGAASSQWLDEQGRAIALREKAVEVRCTKRGGPRGGVITIRLGIEHAVRLGLIRSVA